MELIQVAYSSPGRPGARGFEDLECYQLALVVMVNAHEVVKTLPAHEKYDLADQLRRSSKSSPANIAEGYGRYHYLDSLRFYAIARGSLNETLAHVINAHLLHYIEQPYFEALYDLIRRSEKSLNGYMNYVRKQRQGHDLFGDRTVREELIDYSFETNVDTEPMGNR